MNIRTANLDDVEAIYELGKAVHEFAVNDDTVNFWPKQILRNAVQSKDALVYVAEDDEVVGFVIVNYNHAFKKALIENIYVHPDKRDQGIGDTLLKEILNGLAEIGCEYVTTLVPVDAKGAINLYTNAGFSQGETFLWLDRPLSDTFRQDDAESSTRVSGERSLYR